MVLANSGDYTQRVVAPMIPARYDRITRTATSATIDTWTYYFSGNVQGIVTITYDDADHTNINEAVRTS